MRVNNLIERKNNRIKKRQEAEERKHHHPSQLLLDPNAPSSRGSRRGVRAPPKPAYSRRRSVAESESEELNAEEQEALASQKLHEIDLLYINGEESGDENVLGRGNAKKAQV